MLFIHELYKLNNINTSLLYSLFILLFYLIIKYSCILIPQLFTYDKLQGKNSPLDNLGKRKGYFNSQVKNLSHFS